MIPGRKGGFNVQDEAGYLYNKNHQHSDGSSNWCCVKRISSKCRAAVKVANDRIILQRRGHNHMPNALQ